MNNFHASVSCIMPALQLPKEYRQPSKLAPDHTGEATWSDFRRYQIRADVSPNGVDFLPCQRLISSYCTKLWRAHRVRSMARIHPLTRGACV